MTTPPRSRAQREWESLTPEERAEVQRRVIANIGKMADAFRDMTERVGASAARLKATIDAMPPMPQEGSGSFTGRGRLAP